MTSVDPAYSKLENSVDGFIYIVIVVFIIHVIKHVWNAYMCFKLHMHFLIKLLKIFVG